MKLFALAATAALTAGLATSAVAQTELQTRPQAPPPAPAAAPAPSGSAPLPMPAYNGERLPTFHGYQKSSLELSMGWGAPYGLGLSYAYLVNPHFDVNAGLGIGIGGKIGVGARYYVLPENNFSPYFGVNLTRTGRIEDVKFTNTVTVNGNSVDEEVIYTQRATGVLHLRTGMRWQPKRVGLIGSVGYGVRLSGNPIEYAPNSAVPSRQTRDIIRIVSPGGMELSLGLVIGLSRK